MYNKISNIQQVKIYPDGISHYKTTGLEIYEALIYIPFLVELTNIENFDKKFTLRIRKKTYKIMIN